MRESIESVPFDLTRYRDEFETAYKDVQGLHNVRFVWKNLLRMFESQPDLPAHELVNYWLATTYTRTLAVGIRRQCESGDTRPTIGSLLRRVKAHADTITRESCEFDAVATDWSDDVDGWLHFADAVDKPLDVNRVQPLVDTLAAASAIATRWVNKRVAHFDRAESVDIPTFDELEDALLRLRQGVVFLWRLLNRGQFLVQVTPEFSAQWMEPFRHAWFDPDRMTMVTPRELG